MRIVEIDKDSGFCFGVVNAIENAENELYREGELFCLGDIVHNSQEVNRLKDKGLQTIDHERLKYLYNRKILLRAHGEPPSTYQLAAQNKIQIIDATCKVVLQLQKKIQRQYQASDMNTSQIVIYGKIGHAEVNGLVGQTEGKAIVVEKPEDLDELAFNKDIYLFSQTTMSVDDFKKIVAEIKSKIEPGCTFRYFDTICRQVANRIPNIRTFATKHDLILFVAGKKSSNGKVLLAEAKKANSNTYLISAPEEINSNWMIGIRSVGICGATSTPKWLMEEIAEAVRAIK